jgi:hypothetical protein
MKVIKALLELKFPGTNVEAIMDVISATPNPELATEILCGLYEEKVVENTRVQHKNEGVLTFVSYDKWSDRIRYSYEEVQTKGGYFPKGTKKEDISLETFESMNCRSSTPDCEYIYIPTGVIANEKSYMSFESWAKLPKANEPMIEEIF